MTASRFVTVPDELTELAEAVEAWSKHYGYSVVTEPDVIGFPFTPTFRAKRAQRTVIVEVAHTVELDRLEEWVRFARSTGKDTQVLLVLPDTVTRDPKMDTQLQALGVGLVTGSGSAVAEVWPARDLSMNMELPDIRRFSNRMRRLLGPVYEEFRRSQWREAFGDACTVLESEARRHLKRGVARGRITVVSDTGRTVNLTDAKIDKMTLGALAVAFSGIQRKNHADSVVGEVLARVNRDRIAEAHLKTQSKTEARLRKNAGLHMWRVAHALKILDQEK